MSSNRCDREVIVSAGMRGSPKRSASSVIACPLACFRPLSSLLMPSQNDDRLVDFLEGVEGLFGDAEDGGQHPRRQLADRLADADVVFGFGRAGVLHDDDLQVVGAAVLEIV